MKLPVDSVIAPEKVSRYLLVPQARGDKSRLLAKAGFVPENGEVLLQALREQILPFEAVHLEKSEFGQLFEIIGDLTGPSGRTLSVRTIWMTEGLSGRTKFITLIPK